MGVLCFPFDLKRTIEKWDIIEFMQCNFYMKGGMFGAAKRERSHLSATGSSSPVLWYSGEGLLSLCLWNKFKWKKDHRVQETCGCEMRSGRGLDVLCKIPLARIAVHAETMMVPITGISVQVKDWPSLGSPALALRRIAAARVQRQAPTLWGARYA